MQAVNITAEFRKAFPNRAIAPTEARVIAWADNKVQFDGWVEDDGDYYTREEWNAEEDSATCSACWGIIPDDGVSYVPEDGTLCKCSE